MCRLELYIPYLKLCYIIVAAVAVQAQHSEAAWFRGCREALLKVAGCIVLRLFTSTLAHEST